MTQKFIFSYEILTLFNLSFPQEEEYIILEPSFFTLFCVISFHLSSPPSQLLEEMVTEMYKSHEALLLTMSQKRHICAFESSLFITSSRGTS